MKNNDLAVIILSCDKFSSLWPLFFKRFDEYFPVNIAKIYLLSNYIDCKIDTLHPFKVVSIGEDISWSNNLKKLLTTIEEPNLLLLMDDTPLARVIKNEEFQFFYNSFKEKRMNYCNLKASPAPNGNVGEFFGEILPHTSYRTSVVPCFWRREILLNLLKDHENAWQFEIFGSSRSKPLDRFYSVKKPLIIFDHIIIKGKIDRNIYKKLKNKDEHYGINFPVMNMLEYINEKMNRFTSRVINFFLPHFILSFIRGIKYKN